jgi:hypothetical protein
VLDPLGGKHLEDVLSVAVVWSSVDFDMCDVFTMAECDCRDFVVVVWFAMLLLM